MIKEAIVKIVSKEDLTYDEAYTVMNEIMSGQTSPTQNAAFLAALSKGYEYAMENPQEAAEILMDAAPELRSNEALVVASQEYLADQYTADAARWGEFDPQRWSAFFTWLNDNQLLEGTVDPNAGFTNDYLPAA